jgi:predicted RNA-binding Zn-ribbon protein involved in translation (DUF1610 family)
LFLLFGTTYGTTDFGTRRCSFLPCCGKHGGMVALTCTFQQFTLFFIPLFRFGKRYFITCPDCGAVYEMRKEAGEYAAANWNAEINPDSIFIVQNSYKKTCPACKCSVNSDSRYCPNCGERLI